MDLKINTYSPNIRSVRKVQFGNTSQTPIYNVQNSKRNRTAKNLSIVGGFIAASIAATVGLKKYCSIKKLQKEFSIIFQKEFTLKETKLLAKKYKEITKIDDLQQCEEALREQLKVDFGFSDIGIEFINRNTRFMTSINIYEDNYIIFTKNTDSKEKLFRSYTHEFRHIKQDELSYRCGSKKFFDARKKRALETLKRDYPDEHEIMLKDFIESKVNPFYDRLWGKRPKIEGGTKESELVQKLNAAHDSYYEQTQHALDVGDKELYKQNFIEADAYNVEDAIARVFDILVK